MAVTIDWFFNQKYEIFSRFCSSGIQFIIKEGELLKNRNVIAAFLPPIPTPGIPSEAGAGFRSEPLPGSRSEPAHAPVGPRAGREWDFF